MGAKKQGGKVLVVDDDEPYLKMTSRMLRNAGYEVVTRSDVIGTSFAVASERPDLVLLDLNMTLINGDRLVRLIQRTRVDPPYIALCSGIDERTLKERAVECGADSSIPKGIGPAQFLERIACCFADASAARCVRREGREVARETSPEPRSDRDMTSLRTTLLQIAAGFDKRLGAHPLSQLEAEPGSVVGLWPNGRIALLNSSWQRFAEENGGAEVLRRWPLDSELLSAVSGRLRGYYESAFAQVRADGKPWEQCYQCVTPSLRPKFRLRVLPLAAGSLLLVNSRVVDAELHPEREAQLSLSSHDSADYVWPGGMMRQCSNCRRTQRVRSPKWDWVQVHVTAPPHNVSYGMCPLCMRQDYPDLR